MENKIQQEEVEKSLNGQFSKSGLGKDQLTRISKSIAALQKSGHQIVDWSQFGQPPFEKFVIDTQLPFDKVNAVQQLLADKAFKEIRIFKKGIPPMPNFYNVKLTLENL
ncbi:MAG TPA: hypothetical protein VEY10_02840 [Flavisolibacter sp.]|jgi:hypothetical protein|nr:hypothetical protein [Flavisolibacter sp.]